MKSIHKTTKRAVCVLAATALLGGVAVAATVGSSSAATAAKPASGALTVSPVQTASTMSWTTAAMDAAKPMPLPAPKGGPAVAATSAKPTGKAGAVTGGSPALKAGSAAETSTEVAAAPASVLSPASGSFAYPTPFDRYSVPNVNLYPHSTVGKLFFTQNGGSFVCSASSIGNDAIWTAGHCVSDGAGHFSTNMVFVPAYRTGGHAPFGRFSCNSIIVFTAWHTSGNLSRDSGGASCGKSSLDGRTLSQDVGWLGFAWNQPTADRHFNVLGYPQAAPFDGNLQIQCQSSFGHWDQRSGFSPNTFAVGCDSTGGVSGGPYVMSYRNGNYLAGNASYRYTTPNEPLELYSPYLDTASKSLRDALIA